MALAVTEVPTAVPVFVGYTQTATDPKTGKPVTMTAVSIQSMMDYRNTFGGNYIARFAVAAGDAGAPDFTAADADGASASYVLKSTSDARFNMFVALEMFFANGGEDCYVVSTGPYNGIARKDLLDGLAVAGQLAGPSMLVLPDACLLGAEDYGAVTVAQLDQASSLRDRMAILDLPGALDPAGWTLDALGKQRDAFATAIAPATYAGFGVAYAPALRVSVLGLDDVDFRNLQGTQAGSDLLKSLLVAQATSTFGADTSKGQQVLAKLDQAFPADLSKSTVAPQDIASLNAFLANALPLYAQIETIVLGRLNVAAPSGAMAGIWTANDYTRGVWYAPAGVSINYAVAPEVAVNDTQQAGFTTPTSGLAIDILRAMPNLGTMVWGARTLDGNSNDYRYIQVRRTLIYIEQSIKQALNQFVFAANDADTWAAAVSIVSNFLQGLWVQGALMGAKSADAFQVECGLGSTMTPQNMLDGYMIVQVTLQMVHPAEFIVLTFEQMTQGS